MDNLGIWNRANWYSPGKLKHRTVEWLLCGIHTFKQDSALLKPFYWLRYRSTVMDTLLDDADSQMLEDEPKYLNRFDFYVGRFILQ